MVRAAIHQDEKTAAEVIGRQVRRYEIIKDPLGRPQLLDTVTGTLYEQIGFAWQIRSILTTNLPSFDPTKPFTVETNALDVQPVK